MAQKCSSPSAISVVQMFHRPCVIGIDARDISRSEVTSGAPHIWHVIAIPSALSVHYHPTYKISQDTFVPRSVHFLASL